MTTEVGPLLVELVNSAAALVAGGDARDASGTAWERLERAVGALKAADVGIHEEGPAALRALLQCTHRGASGTVACSYCGSAPPRVSRDETEWRRPILLEELGRALGVLP